MNKQKYLHRKGHDDKKWKNHSNCNKNNCGDETPFRESIRDKHKKEYFWNWKIGLDFTPTGEYIEENVNRNWDDVYSEIIKKTKPKFRWLLENFLDYFLAKAVIVDYIPYRSSWNRSTIVLNWVFVDEDGILRNYNTTKEVEDMSKRKIRRDKLLKLQKISDESDI